MKQWVFALMLISADCSLTNYNSNLLVAVGINIAAFKIINSDQKYAENAKQNAGAWTHEILKEFHDINSRAISDVHLQLFRAAIAKEKQLFEEKNPKIRIEVVKAGQDCSSLGSNIGSSERQSFKTIYPIQEDRGYIKEYLGAVDRIIENKKEVFIEVASSKEILDKLGRNFESINDLRAHFITTLENMLTLICNSHPSLHDPEYDSEFIRVFVDEFLYSFDDFIAQFGFNIARLFSKTLFEEVARTYPWIFRSAK